VDVEARWREIERAEPALRADAEARAVARVLKRFDSLQPLARYGGSTFPSDMPADAARPAGIAGRVS
jgi:hypothetical protein